MISPEWLADILAAVVIAVALFSAARLVAARGRRRRCEVDADGMHVLMGVAMAGMLVPRLATLPDPVWGAVFAAGAGWFGWRAIRVRGLAPAGGPTADTTGPGLGRDCCPYPVPHLIDCLAMVYALFAVPAIAAARAPATGGGMSGMGGAGGGASFPVIGLVLAVCVCGYVVWLADRIQRFAGMQTTAPATAAASAATGWSRASGPARAATWGGRAADQAMPGPAMAGSAMAGSAMAGMTGPAPAGPGSPPAVAAMGQATAGRPASPVHHQHTQHAAALLAPRTATCCKIAMGVAMVVMLIDLL
jgi:hypothetical protein